MNNTVHKAFLANWKQAAKAGLTNDRIYHVFEAMTEDGAAKEQPDLTHVLDEQFLRDQGLDDQQMKFAREWNDAMNRELVMEHGYGVQTQGSIGDRVYVPYRVKRSFIHGGFKQIGTTQSFQHARAGEYSISALRDAVSNGSASKDIVTDPIELFRSRMVQGSQAMANAGWRAAMGDMYGIPAKVSDSIENARRAGVAEEKAQALQDHLDLVDLVHDSHARDEVMHQANLDHSYEALDHQINEQIKHNETLMGTLEEHMHADRLERDAAVAQKRLAVKGVGKPLSHVLTGMMKRAQTVDDLKALWAKDAKDAVATNFDLSTVTDKQIALARKQVYDRTQASLIKRGMPEKMVVYRAGRLGKGVQSFSLQPIKQFGKQEAYLVDRADVLADANAFFPGAHVLEDEVLVKTEQVTKTTAQDVKGQAEVLAQQRVVKNVRDQADRAVNNIAEEVVRSYGLADDYLQHLAEMDSASVGEGVTARAVEGERHAMASELDSVRKELAANDREAKDLAARHADLTDKAENGNAQFLAEQEKHFAATQQS